MAQRLYLVSGDVLEVTAEDGKVVPFFDGRLVRVDRPGKVTVKINGTEEVKKIEPSPLRSVAVKMYSEKVEQWFFGAKEMLGDEEGFKEMMALVFLPVTENRFKDRFQGSGNWFDELRHFLLRLRPRGIAPQKMEMKRYGREFCDFLIEKEKVEDGHRQFLGFAGRLIADELREAGLFVLSVAVSFLVNELGGECEVMDLLDCPVDDWELVEDFSVIVGDKILPHLYSRRSHKRFLVNFGQSVCERAEKLKGRKEGKKEEEELKGEVPDVVRLHYESPLGKEEHREYMKALAIARGHQKGNGAVLSPPVFSMRKVVTELQAVVDEKQGAARNANQPQQTQQGKDAAKPSDQKKPNQGKTETARQVERQANPTPQQGCSQQRRTKQQGQKNPPQQPSQTNPPQQQRQANPPQQQRQANPPQQQRQKNPPQQPRQTPTPPGQTSQAKPQQARGNIQVERRAPAPAVARQQRAPGGVVIEKKKTDTKPVSLEFGKKAPGTGGS